MKTFFLHNVVGIVIVVVAAILVVVVVVVSERSCYAVTVIVFGTVAVSVVGVCFC